MDIQSRVVNYYKTNSFIQKYLKGIDPKSNEVVLAYNNENRRVGIDVLEGIKSEEELINFFQGKVVSNEPVAPVVPEVPVAPVQPQPVAPVVPEQPAVVAPVQTPSLDSVSITPVSTEAQMVDESKPESLDDIKLLTELKNKEGLDNLLKKYAINPTTGLIDINNAISTVTRNTMNEVEDCIRNSFDFNTDLTQYDIQGKYIGPKQISAANEDELIIKSFNNIKIYLDASKMYPEQVNYNDEQINSFLKTYISKVKEELHGSEPQTDSSNTNPTPPAMMDTDIPAGVNASAGFADIFVLTVIVLVYAVIIVNLILKLK